MLKIYTQERNAKFLCCFLMHLLWIELGPLKIHYVGVLTPRASECEPVLKNGIFKAVIKLNEVIRVHSNP